jgi:2-polyprenyl-3-methyl-5-hydroxy-6-metoxy-1,4-benzoquinol methylase
MNAPPAADAVTARALLSKGISADPIYRMVRRELLARNVAKDCALLDVGCGTGALCGYVLDLCGHYEGADVVRYPEFPAERTFRRIDLDTGRMTLADGCKDAVVCVETVEHIENPRALVRELARVAKPGGVVLVTTPNILSLLSKLTLVLKNQFNAFQEPCYPAHITALVETDLRRIFAEAGLRDVRAAYSGDGRIPGGPWHWPRFLGGRAFSDNILLSGIKPS